MEILSENLKVAIYTRVSTEEQREGQTIDSQVAELERFAREKGWDVAGVYRDEGWSGSVLARPELDRLRDQASAGQFNQVLINDVDRLARDVSHLGIVKRDLERVGVEIIFRKLPAEKSPTHNLMVNILGSFAEFEREMIIDRTRRGRRHKVETRQQFLGSKPAYGYRYVLKDSASGTDGYLEVNAEESVVVKQMYEWVAKEGLSICKVQRRLNTQRIPSRSGREWAKSTTIKILRSEIYAGVWHYNKHYSCEPTQPLIVNKYRRPKSSTRLRPRSEWLPVILPKHLRLVDRDQWEQVQQQLTSNIALSPRNSNHVYLLKGLVKCAGCNATYIGDPCHGKFYYRCRQRCKKVPSVREERLDKTVWNAVEEALSNPANILGQITAFRKRNEKAAAKFATEGNSVQQALEALREEESRILEAYRTGIIVISQLSKELEKLKIRKESLMVRMNSIETSGTMTAEDIRHSVMDYCAFAMRRLKSFTLDQRQRFLRLLVSSVVFDGQRVTIRGGIPFEPGSDKVLSGKKPGQNTPGHDEYPQFDRRRPATTTTHYKGPNTVRFATTTLYSHGRNSDSTSRFEFTLVKPLVEKTISAQPRGPLGKFVSRDRPVGKLAA